MHFLGGTKFEKNYIFKGINKILHFCTAGNSLDPDSYSRSSDQNSLRLIFIRFSNPYNKKQNIGFIF